MKPGMDAVGIHPFSIGGVMTPREELIQKLKAAKAELSTAGLIHQRDLRKYIHRLKRELHDYNRFQREAGFVPHNTQKDEEIA